MPFVATSNDDYNFYGQVMGRENARPRGAGDEEGGEEEDRRVE